MGAARTSAEPHDGNVVEQEPELVASTHGRWRVHQLNRPRALNALTAGMVKAIRREYRDLCGEPGAARPPGAPCAVLTEGRGGRAFCAGGDVVAVTTAPKSVLDDATSDFFHLEYSMNMELATQPLPQVSLWDGIVMGGGVGLSIHGAFRVATERTVLAMPEVQIGLFPDIGASWFMPRLRGRYGAWLGLTGARITGAAARELGLATHLIASSAIPALREELLALEHPGEASIRAVLDAAELSHRAPHGGAVVPAEDLPPAQEVEAVFAPDEGITGVVARLEKTAQTSEWARKALSQLQSASPLAVCLTWRMLELGATSTLAEVLQREAVVARRKLDARGPAGAGDFAEGVAAALVRRDKSPKWRHGSLDAVSAAEVEGFLTPLPGDTPLNLTWAEGWAAAGGRAPGSSVIAGGALPHRAAL
ncbi:unnamed protein product [Pedinophyceae sp. YPF-701]|nr:unnamed protein product [Pedinophyceae sp. YPF-701]